MEKGGLTKIFIRFYCSYSSKFRYSYTHGASEIPLLNETISSILLNGAERNPDKELFIFPKDGIRKTYSQLFHDARGLASGLHAIGLNKGDRVGIWAPNVYEWVITQFGTALAGMVLVNINPAYRPNELKYCLNKVGVRCLISSITFKTQDYYEILNEICPALPSSTPGHVNDEKVPSLKHVIFLGDQRKPGAWSFHEIMQAGDSKSDRKLNEAIENQQSDEPVNIQFTSGTTGHPKGATLSHHNIINNAYFMGRRLNLHEKPSVICCPPPLYHCVGCVFGTLSSVLHDATSVFPTPTFDAGASLKAVHEEKCTHMYGTPTMFIDMMSHKDFSKYDYSSLRGGIMTGAPCPIQLCHGVMEKMNMKEFSIFYGTTENSPATFSTKSTDPVERRVSTVGTVVDHTEAKIVDHENRIVKIDQPGELLIRGYCVMLGYWNDKDKTKEVIQRDRWYRTGDQAVMDSEGYVRIVGRIKDMIIRGGENIYPTEIERLLFTNPKVEDAHVVGVPDPRLGEALCAWIRLRKSETCTSNQIKEFCKGKIAHFKIPQYVLFKDEKDFPVTVTGKIQKHKIREISIDHLKLRHDGP